ncbi:Predicted pyrophosphatase or phosphodiesterase, AlkP superfamily [Dyadobacter soli]|uniref:Predicted pyrophosphatase or phosphodiesterase, AlkP superfamily n=1 Tax=Dyadobacter soli TaxID=659014 RepID=A0A1G7KZD5_9BACT|nr:alkaline phosphatase family protein [Dyadobacter soli]SDF42099.1 Predicted pyrophosphatase or phosphodiesterase, AlkP superfamily [Dyadobacter soli]
MKKLILLLTLSTFTFKSLRAQDAHVILISIDGLRPEFYKDPTWSMVNLRQGMETGAYADGVNGVFPTVTYPSHTTMITGVKPIKHGVYYNTPPEPLEVTGKWIWDYKTIKVPTIFGAAKDKGLKTASVFWPVSLGGPADYNIPEYWYLPETKGGKRNMTKALNENSNPQGFYEEIQQNATGKLEEIDFDGEYLSIDDNLSRTSAYIIRKYKPSFLAVHLVAVDHFEHEQGRDGDKVRAALTSVDRGIKAILEAIEKAGIKEKTTVIVTGDHGFVDIHSSLSPNMLLAQAGLYDPKNPSAWKAYFHASGGSSFLHLKDKNDTQTLEKAKAALAKLPVSQKAMFEIKDRAALDAIGSDPNAAFALAPKQGFTIGNAATGDFVRAASGGTHGFFPDFKEIQTGFVAFGRGIKKGAVIPEMGLQDIAPLVAKLLSIDFPTADGTVYPGMLTKE